MPARGLHASCSGLRGRASAAGECTRLRLVWHWVFRCWACGLRAGEPDAGSGKRCGAAATSVPGACLGGGNVCGRASAALVPSRAWRASFEAVEDSEVVMDASKGDAAAPHSRSSNAREHAGSGSGPPAQHVSSTGAGLGAGVGAGAGAASATVQSHRDRMASPVGFPRRSDAPGAAAAAQHSGRSATVPATAGPATEHEWVSTIVPGQDLDVLDTFGKWCHAIAADVSAIVPHATHASCSSEARGRSA